MQKALAWTVWGGVAANAALAAMLLGSGSPKPIAPKAQLELAALEPIREPAARPAAAAAAAVAAEQSGSFACLVLGPLDPKDAGAAAELVATAARAKAFDAGAGAKDVRFGPWPKAELAALDKVLAPWRPAKLRPCDEKESLTWEASK